MCSSNKDSVNRKINQDTCYSSICFLVMEDQQIRRLPILNREKHLVGIISVGDLAVRTRDERLVEEVMERVCEPAPA